MKDYRRVARTLAIAFEHDPFTNYILNTSSLSRENTLPAIYSRKKLHLFDAYFAYAVYENMRLNGPVYVIKDNTTEALLSQSGVKTCNFPYLAALLWLHIYGPDIDSESSSDSALDDEDALFAQCSLNFRGNIHPSFLKFHYWAIKANCRSRIVKDKLPFLEKMRNHVLWDTLINRNHEPIDIWYLAEIATLPALRGKGLGKILIKHVIDACISPVSLAARSRPHIYLESSNPQNRGFYEKLRFRVECSFSIKHNCVLDPVTASRRDPSNLQVIMDSMVYYPPQTPY